MQDRITRLASWARFVPKQVAPALAQHRWHLLKWAERQGLGRSLTLLRPFYIRREAYEGWHATANG